MSNADHRNSDPTVPAGLFRQVSGTLPAVVAQHSGTGPAISAQSATGDLLELKDSTGVTALRVTQAGAMLGAAAPEASTRLLTSGEAVLDRWQAVANVASPTSGSLLLTYFTALKTESITQVVVASGSTAAAATPTLVRVGIYSVNAATGALTGLLASIANDTTIFAVANTKYTRTLTSTFSKVAGTRYAVGVLVVTAAVAPTYTGIGAATNTTHAWIDGPPLNMAIGSQADLPATVAAASLSGLGRALQTVLLP